MSVVQFAEQCRKVEYCKHANNVRSDSRGPNIVIELNFWHAQQLCGLLQEFRGSFVSQEVNFGDRTMPYLQPKEGISKFEQAIGELYITLSSKIQDHLNAGVK